VGEPAQRTIRKRHFDAVLFDFGDTLFHRAGGPPVMVELARSRGVTVTENDVQRVWDEVQDAARTPEALAKGRDLSTEAHRREWLALYAAFDQLADGLGAAVYEHEMVPGGWVPFTDAEPVLRALHDAGVKIGVVSDAGWDIRVMFSAAGIEDLVDSFVLSYEIGAVKPAPEPFLRACEDLGVAPERCVMVGDNTPDAGAVRVGIATYLLPLAPPGGPRGLDAVVRLVGVGAGTVAAS
jgi:HAD superfamily hydrolase (TIGR01509 family)